MRRSLVALTLLVCVACGDGDSASSETTSTPSPTGPVEIERPSSQVDPEPSPTPVGTEITLGGARAAVLEYQTSVPPAEVAEPGQRWDAALVSSCNDAVTETEATTVAFNERAWQLRDGAGGRYEASTVKYRQFPVPVYPSDINLQIGDCVQGWIVFPVAADAQIESVVWSVDGEDLSTWTLS
ncbi:hypothetical protein HMPREF0063_10099 [Aeromicrobium marinum DSM 15272]|uniref:DUF4352 domain-containing protein n=1 Tax=Aeromicrobium marinum DSM 15272 TaxID=585531 RepID=E2S7U2_9ACTN|nr:hypothetical protein [Aeromicrobium marinum]EFQ84758.1 hypothetical protein HMPREF0063_10099 [Aeromicrobium marinum DSM 15272]